MKGHDLGPRRSGSVDALLRGTRVLAIVAVVALAVAILSDATEGSFWARHALLGGLVASVIVVMLSAAIINEALERRRRERWRVLAQFVMLEFVRGARLVWTGVLAQVGVIPYDAARPELVDQNRLAVQDTDRLTAAVTEAIADDDVRRDLQDEIARLSAHSGETLGRWAAVMLNADVYAEVVDRHVELASEINWLSGLLDNAEPPEDRRRARRAFNNPSSQFAGSIVGEDLAKRIVVIAQFAEELDRNTMNLALRVVPLEWWEGRLGVTLAPEDVPATSAGDAARAPQT